MIPIKFDPATLKDPSDKAWWDAWSGRAEAATRRAVTAFETWLANGQPRPPFEFEFNPKIWKDLKDWLLEHVFHEKCAYCEREISGYYGDAEHYRPKGVVKHKTVAGEFEEATCAVADPVKGQDVTLPHPGYFWLAYDWRNLLPSCVFCNSGHGKNDRFDIAGNHVVLAKLNQAEVDGMPPMARPRQSEKWPGYYYLAPPVLDALEDPRLLNPLNATDDRDPRKHLRFGVCGTVAAVDGSPLGETSIEALQLLNEKLRIARQKAQESFQDRYFDACRQLDPKNPRQSKAQSLLHQYSAGCYPFSAAALDYHKFFLRPAEAALDS